MKARAIALAWLAAVLVAGATLAVLARPVSVASPHFAGEPVAVIGNSLIRHAIPASGPAGDLLPGEGAYVRMGMPNAHRAHLLRMMRDAVDGGAQVVLLEAGPFLFNFSGQEAIGDCRSLECRIDKSAMELRANGSTRINRLLGRDTLDDMRTRTAATEPLWDARITRQMRDDSAYPLLFNVDLPDPALRAEIVHARARGVRVALILSPRSPRAQAMLGSQQAELDARSQELASDLGVALFSPQDRWVDADFLDRAHLSRQGRAHFMARLAAWWQDNGQLAQEPR